MKNITNYLQISLLLLVLLSCSNEPTIVESNSKKVQNSEVFMQKNNYENQSQSEISIYEIERPYYIESLDEEISILFTIGISEEDDDLHFFEVSENILNITGLSKAELELEVIESTHSDPENPNEDLSPHAKCIEDCKDKYTDEYGNKINGRGTCKANCWVDTAIRVLDAGVPF
ncbi:hypothetical protein ACFSQ0_01115 [Mesonia sediminis]|uniref:PAS domain-containing protein n=1 Tax=Mesonia sediminis TaxID=1703946 RepID=A0ABW5SBR8_9FLAO